MYLLPAVEHMIAILCENGKLQISIDLLVEACSPSHVKNLKKIIVIGLARKLVVIFGLLVLQCLCLAQIVEVL